MQRIAMLAICGALLAFGLLTVAVSSGGLFMSLLGAGMMGTGGAAGYLMIMHERDTRVRKGSRG